MRSSYKRKFNLKDYYYSSMLSHRAILKLMKNRISKVIDSKFIERLMLAVTEVNGCDVCSYAHTQMALKEGYTQEEIESFLSGSNAYINKEEAKAILFAQHYADSRSFPDQDAYNNFVKEYGIKKSKIILSAIQVMMFANIAGVPMSAFFARLKGRKYKISSIMYELGMQVSILVIWPISLVHSLLRFLTFRKNIISRKK